MTDKRHLNPAHIDAALHGSAVAPGLEPLSTWADDIRRQTATEIPLDTAAAQISALAETAAAANPGGAGYTALKPSRLERLRRRLVFGSLLSGIGAKVFAASVALATATGGVAATGSLPDAVQGPIATVYNSVGFDFPTSHDDDECEADETSCDNEGAETDDEDAPGSHGDDDSDDVNSDDKNSGDDDDANDDDANDDDANDDDANDKKDSDDKPGKGLGRDKGKGNQDGDDQGDDDQGDQGGGDEG